MDVSALCLGCMLFGTLTSEETAYQLADRKMGRGVKRARRMKWPCQKHQPLDEARQNELSFSHTVRVLRQLAIRVDKPQGSLKNDRRTK
jgi:hypothetical protein